MHPKMTLRNSANTINTMMKIQHTNSKTIDDSLRNLLNLPSITLNLLTMLDRIEVLVLMEMKAVDFHLMAKKVVNFQALVVMKEKSSMEDLQTDQTGHGSYDFEVAEVLLSVVDLSQQLLIAVSITCNWE